ncbi:MAG: M1 family peptidase, partial [Bacteroidota bacterium]
MRLAFLAVLCLAVSAPAQDRVLPYPIVPTPGYQQAVENGTRTPDGKPGPNYWQNFAAYDIDATLDPESGRV